MRKYFLLIAYVTGFLFTHKCIEAGYNSAFAARSVDSNHSLIQKSAGQIGEYSFNSPASTFVADIDLEDDGELKAKAISTGDPLYQYANLRRLNEIEMIEFSALDRPTPSRILFKLNQVFRL